MPPKKAGSLKSTFALAADRYAELGVNVHQALKTLSRISISIPCWQGDDVGGFEPSSASSTAGFAATGNYPGKARSADELRLDFEKACSLIPGKHRFSLHASYGDFHGQRVDRNQIGPEQFKTWIAWAANHGLGLDFNATCFAHPKATAFTLSHPDKAIRRFWIEHCRRCREIGAAFGKALGQPCVTNVWIPDGIKDTPADRWSPRERLAESLDEVFRPPIPSKFNLDAIEGKLFGIGSESYVVGSHEFYLGYAITRRKWLTLDAGHFHPTESVADKLSSILPYVPGMFLHLSRGVRWDSDHVVVVNDDLLAIAREIVAGKALEKIRLGLDFFDASINRVAGWVIGTRNLLRGLLVALLEPPAIRQAEAGGDDTTRLALQEEAKALPWGAIWDWHCETQGVPAAEGWLREVKRYEATVLSKRS